MNNVESLPKLYTDLADWWPILSSPEDYAEEAKTYRQAIVSASSRPVRTLLELGSGGGNNASHLKKHFEMTLVDIAPGMLEVSRRLNPECEHIQGDMRTVRLDRQFDAVFIHDAIAYMTTEEDLRRALATAYEHCRPGGGLALFACDCTSETFKPGTSHGGHEQGSCSMRYLEWDWDPDPSDTSYLSLMVYALREGADSVRCVEDLHVMGLFSRDTWLRLISEVGFAPSSFSWVDSEEGTLEVFQGLRPPE